MCWVIAPSLFTYAGSDTEKELRTEGADPLVCLSLSAAFTQMLGHSKLLDRHHCFAKAVAFMQAYAKARQDHTRINTKGVTDTDGQAWRLKQEIKYNTGRCFHQAGLTQFAFRYYEEVLQLHDKHVKKVPERSGTGEVEQQEGLEKEAAHNLALIYWNNGSKELARHILEKYLSL